MLQNSMCVSKPKIVILHLCNRFWATFLKCALLCCNLQFEDYRPLLLYCKIVNLEKKLRKNFSFFRKFSRLYNRQLYVLLFSISVRIDFWGWKIPISAAFYPFFGHFRSEGPSVLLLELAERSNDGPKDRKWPKNG